jgi:hypothetical protein
MVFFTKIFSYILLQDVYLAQGTSFKGLYFIDTGDKQRKFYKKFII